MKTVLQTILLLFFLAFFSCSKKSDPTTDEVNTRILTSNTWIMKNVSLDGTDITSSFAGLTLSFTSKTFTTTNDYVVWPASGTWAFTNPDAKIIQRDDQIVVSVEEISNSKLTLSLDWAENTLGGRILSLKGHHVFEFTRK